MARKNQTHQLDAADRNAMPDSTFAFPRLRKEPLNDAGHVRNASARLDQARDASDAERADAFRRIKKAAERFGVELTEDRWQDLGKPSATTKKAGTPRTQARSGRNRSGGDRSKDELYAEAKRRNIRGRSAMTKAELQ